MYYQPDSSGSNQYQPQNTGSDQHQPQSTSSNQYQPPFNNQPTQQGAYSGSYPYNAAPNSANQQSSADHFDDWLYQSQYPPTFAGQFGYPSTPPPKKGIWNWYRGQKKGAQIGIGCGAIFLVLLLCLCSASAMANGQSPAKTASSATATPTTFVQTGGATPTVTVLSTPTSIPPTATPVPPTAIPPTPTLVPAAAVPTHAPVPTPLPTRAPVPTRPPAPTPTPALKTGVNGNPWGYDFNASGGSKIYAPPSNFCTYFNCIKSFWKSTNGYIDECNDGTFSHSGGVSGACSSHGGEMRPLYSHG